MILDLEIPTNIPPKTASSQTKKKNFERRRPLDANYKLPDSRWIFGQVGSEFFSAIFLGKCQPKGSISSLGIYPSRLPKDVGFCRESRSPLPSVYTSHPTRLRYGKWYGGSNLLGSTWNFSRNPLEAWISKAAANGLFILVSWYPGPTKVWNRKCVFTNKKKAHLEE